MREVQPPNDFSEFPRPWVFLAGSIEMSTAEEWQNKVITIMQDRSGTLLNPRRTDWDASWKPEASNEQFRKQVEWELKGQEEADIVFMYFDPKTKSPITLLELGLLARDRRRLQRSVVCCPEGFWRKGNIDIICDRYKIWRMSSFEKAIDKLGGWVGAY